MQVEVETKVSYLRFIAVSTLNAIKPFMADRTPVFMNVGHPHCIVFAVGYWFSINSLKEKYPLIK